MTGPITVRCGHCATRHTSAAAVRACAAGNLFACGWAVQRWVGWTDEETGWSDGDYQIVDCAAEAIGTERGWSCAAGHEHVTAEARVAEGWDFAEEYGEALDLVMAGVEPRTMSGHLVTSPAVFAGAGR